MHNLRTTWTLGFLLLIVVSAAAQPPAPPVAYVTRQTANAVDRIVLNGLDWTSTATIPVGNGPTGIAIPSTGGFAYVANLGGTVSRIELATSTVSATITGLLTPSSVAFVPDGTKAYVVETAPVAPPPGPTPTPGPTPPVPTPTPTLVYNVAVIDTATNAITTRVQVGNQPLAVAVSRNGSTAYVTNHGDGTVTVIATATDTIVDTIEVGATPEGIAVGSGFFYVTNDADETVMEVSEADLNVIRELDVGAGPFGVAVAPDGAFGIVSNDVANSVTVFQPSTAAVLYGGPIPLDDGENPTGIAITADSTRALVANSGGDGGSLSIVKLEEGILEEQPLEGAPTGVAFVPAARLVISKSATPNPAPAGGTVTFTIVYSNLGTGVATGVTITDPVPAHLTFVSATQGGALAGGDVVWTLPDLLPGGAATVQATYTVDPATSVPEGTTVTNTATLAATGLAPVQASRLVAIDSNPQYDISASAPDPVVPGSLLTYTVNYGNLGTGAAATASRIIAAFDPSVAFISAVPAPTTGTNEWFLGNLAAGATGSITITVQVASPLGNGTTLTSSFTITDASAPEHDVTAQAVNTVQSAPSLTISLQDTPDPVAASTVVTPSELTYEVVIANSGNDAATDVVVTFSYAPEVAFASASIPPDDPSGTQFTIATVGAGRTVRLTVHTLVSSVVPNGTIITTGVGMTDSLGATGSASADTTIQSAPGLALVKTDSPDPVLEGGQITYTLTYANVGSDVANGVVVSEIYPPGTSFVSSVPPPINPGDPFDPALNNQWNVGTLAPGASGTIVVTVALDPFALPNGSTASNVAVMIDDVGNSAQATEVTVVDQIPALTLAISDSPDPVLAGALLTYSVQYGNQGTEDATGVQVSVTYPAGVTFFSSTPPPDPGTTDTWTISPNLPVGATGQIQVLVLVDPNVAPGTLLQVGAQIQDSTGQVQTASETTDVQVEGNLVLRVADFPDAAVPGSEVTYALLYANQGTQAVAGLSILVDPASGLAFAFSDPLPSPHPPTVGQSIAWPSAVVPAKSGGVILAHLDVDPLAPLGASLLSQVRLESPVGTVVSDTTILTTVGAGSGLDVEIERVAAVVDPFDLYKIGPLAVTEYDIRWGNTSGAAISGVTLNLAVDPHADSPGATSWNLGTLAPGASGVQHVQVMSSAPVGSLLTFTASISGVGGASDLATTHLLVTGAQADANCNPLDPAAPGRMLIHTGRYEPRFSPTTPRGNGGFQARIDPCLVPSATEFNPAIEPLLVSMSTDDGVLFAVNAFGVRTASGGFKYKGTTTLPGGDKMKIRLRQEGTTGYWLLRVQTKRSALRFLDTAATPVIRLGVAFPGRPPISTDCVYEVRKEDVNPVIGLTKQQLRCPRSPELL